MHKQINRLTNRQTHKHTNTQTHKTQTEVASEIDELLSQSWTTWATQIAKQVKKGFNVLNR